MSKGSVARPMAIKRAEFDERWNHTFGILPFGKHCIECERFTCKICKHGIVQITGKVPESKTCTNCAKHTED